VEKESRTVAVYIINLDRDKERLSVYLNLNAHLSHVMRFPAIDGNLVDRSALEKRGIIGSTLTYGNGQLGCALSHIVMWRKAIELKSHVTVTEDDVVLAKNFLSAHDSFLDALPEDWDIVHWGWNFDRPVWAEIPEGVARSTMQFDQDELRKNIETFRNQQVAHAPVRLRHCFGTMAYTVSPAGAKTLLDICLPLADKLVGFPGYGIGVYNRGIDCLMNGAYPNMKAYVCMPPLAVSENRQENSRTYEDFVQN
jgi:GR25 family glycosyltransferase involved in LPS biosynthesis